MNNQEKIATNKNNVSRSKIAKCFRRLTLGKILKFIAVLLIAAVYVLLIGRMLLARNYGIMNRFVWTENALSEYSASPESFGVMSHQLSESIDDNGLYHISNYAYVPEIGELQITVRYNNSALDTLDTYYSDRSSVGETFVFTLEDDKGNVYDSYKYASSSNLIYNFRRLVFEGIDFENTGTLYLNVYYVNDISDSAPMSVSFRIYDKDIQAHESNIKINYKADKADTLDKSPVFAYN